MKVTNISDQLESDQVRRFYCIWLRMLSFVNERHKIVPSMIGKDFHKGIDADDAEKIAKHIWDHPEAFDELLKTLDTDKDASDAEALRLWKEHRIVGKFYIVKYLKSGAVLLSADNEDTEKPFLVKGLASAFDDMFPKENLPYLVNTVLLPFEGVIVTCGLFRSAGISFGSSISRDIRESCRKAELAYGLIESLPFARTIGKEEKEIAQIRFYLRSEKEAELYREELEYLIRKNPAKYEPIYFVHRGELTVRTLKREYRKLGLKKFHFAVYGSVAVAAHPDPRQVKIAVEKLIPAKDMDRIVYGKM